jgi:hypothetical protein
MKSKILILSLTLSLYSFIPYSVNNNSEKILSTAKSQRTDIKLNNFIQVHTKIINKTKYSFYNTKELVFVFTDNRPNKNNGLIKLCIPAAYTEGNKIDGKYKIKVEQGKINHRLEGMLVIAIDSTYILRMNRTSSTQKFDIPEQNTISYFQQSLYLKGGKILTEFLDKQIFQRRGCIKKIDGSLEIVESETAITVEKFAKDMKQVGALDLLNFDMGTYSEGWYRSGNKIHCIGNDRSSTLKQTNWLVLKSKAK